MTDAALLPPDPSAPGRYWIKAPVEWANPEIWMWSPSSGRWHHDLSFDWSPEGFAAEGYTLATPHPIPGPAALEAVCKVIGSMDPALWRRRHHGGLDVSSPVDSRPSRGVILGVWAPSSKASRPHWRPY